LAASRVEQEQKQQGLETGFQRVRQHIIIVLQKINGVRRDYREKYQSRLTPLIPLIFILFS
jgi:hypothetical protein